MSDDNHPWMADQTSAPDKGKRKLEDPHRQQRASMQTRFKIEPGMTRRHLLDQVNDKDSPWSPIHHIQDQMQGIHQAIAASTSSNADLVSDFASTQDASELSDKSTAATSNMDERSTVATSVEDPLAAIHRQIGRYDDLAITDPFVGVQDLFQVGSQFERGQLHERSDENEIWSNEPYYSGWGAMFPWSEATDGHLWDMSGFSAFFDDFLETDSGLVNKVPASAVTSRTNDEQSLLTELDPLEHGETVPGTSRPANGLSSSLSIPQFGPLIELVKAEFPKILAMIRARQTGGTANDGSRSPDKTVGMGSGGEASGARVRARPSKKRKTSERGAAADDDEDDEDNRKPKKRPATKPASDPAPKRLWACPVGKHATEDCPGWLGLKHEDWSRVWQHLIRRHIPKHCESCFERSHSTTLENTHDFKKRGQGPDVKINGALLTKSQLQALHLIKRTRMSPEEKWRRAYCIFSRDVSCPHDPFLPNELADVWDGTWRVVRNLGPGILMGIFGESVRTLSRGIVSSFMPTAQALVVRLWRAETAPRTTDGPQRGSIATLESDSASPSSVGTVDEEATPYGAASTAASGTAISDSNPTPGSSVISPGVGVATIPSSSREQHERQPQVEKIPDSPRSVQPTPSEGPSSAPMAIGLDSEPEDNPLGTAAVAAVVATDTTQIHGVQPDRNDFHEEVPDVLDSIAREEAMRQLSDEQWRLLFAGFTEAEDESLNEFSPNVWDLAN